MGSPTSRCGDWPRPADAHPCSHRPPFPPPLLAHSLADQACGLVYEMLPDRHRAIVGSSWRPSRLPSVGSLWHVEHLQAQGYARPDHGSRRRCGSPRMEVAPVRAYSRRRRLASGVEQAADEEADRCGAQSDSHHLQPGRPPVSDERDRGVDSDAEESQGAKGDRQGQCFRAG